MPSPNNPLRQFFRQPAIYIQLPSGGQGYPSGALDYPANGEIPVYPMTAVDEITYQTPDALFNGEAVVSVIQSCVPNIKDGWAVPAVDLDAVLVAIRIASYGHSMDIGTKCPKCETENDFGLDLRTIIDRLEVGDYQTPLVIGDLEIYFRSLNYRDMTANAQAQFEQQKTIQMLNDADMPESNKLERINVMMRNIVEMTLATMSKAILQIRTPQGIVEDHDHIQEFLNNCDRTMFNRIRDHVINLRESSEIKPLKLKCPNCQNDYNQPFTLDMSRFFASGS